MQSTVTKAPVGLWLARGSQPVGMSKRGGSRFDPYGSRTARPPIGGKQQSSGLLFSAGVPPCRNVYRGCCIMQPVRGIEGTRPPAGGKKEPGGLFFSVRVPTARNVYRGCCRHDPYGNRTARPPIGGKQQSSGLLFSAGVPPCRNVYCGCCRFPLRPLPVKMRLERPAGRDKRK